MSKQLTYTNNNKIISFGSFLCKDGCIVYKIVRINDANLFLEYLEEENIYIVRCNKSIPKALIEQYVRNNYEWIANWYKNVENPAPWYIFNNPIPVKVIIGNTHKVDYTNNQINVYLRHKRDYKAALISFYKNIAKEYLAARLQELSTKLNRTCNFGDVKWVEGYLGRCWASKKIDFNAKIMQYPKDYIDSVIYHELAHLTYLNHSKSFWNLLSTYCPNHKQLDKEYIRLSLSGHMK